MMDETWRFERREGGELPQMAVVAVAVRLGTVLAEQYKSRDPMPDDGQEKRRQSH